MRHFREGTVEWLRSMAATGASRSAMAGGLCEREGWTNAAGAPCLASARLALPGIAERYGIALPSAGRPPPGRRGPLPDHPDIHFSGTLAELGGVGLEMAETAEQRRALRAMMESHHPQGEPSNPGALLFYWISSERLGRVGGLCFHAANWHQRARDAYIGWSGRERMANLRLLVQNSRFLILPGVEVPHLASHVLGLAARRLPDDWERLHGVRPAMAFTYVGAERPGTAYAAAGWEFAGSTSGRPPGHREGAEACGVWMRPLDPDWRDRMCRGPRTPRWLGPAPAVPENADWADLEFGLCGHADSRVRDRILAMARAWETRPGEPVSVVFPDRKDQKAAYRLLSNPRVSMDDIIESHRMATLWRCRAEREVLAIQDTTMLDFSGLKGSTGGLAKLGGGGSGSVGIPAHVTLAVSASGRGLGVLAIDAGFREGVTVKVDRRRGDTGRAETEPDRAAETETPDGGSESRRWLEGLALAQEVGRTSPGTRVITVCDREGDIWDMFEAQAEDPAAAGLLVRSSASTRRSVIAGGGVVDLMEHVSGLPAAGTRTVHVAARGGITGSRGRKAVRARPARTAETEIRVARVELKAPGKSRQTLPVTAVLASETTTPPKGGRRLSWLLLSSDAKPDLQGAIDTVRRYERRWTIEEYFKTLKQCTRIEDRRLDEADDLRRCLAFDAVTAWRVFDIQRAAKAEPDRPALDFLDADELTALYIAMGRYRFRNVRAPPFDGLTIREAAIDIGRYVGFIPSKRQPLPGTEKMWKGMKYLLLATEMYRAMREWAEPPESPEG